MLFPTEKNGSLLFYVQMIFLFIIYPCLFIYLEILCVVWEVARLLIFNAILLWSVNLYCVSASMFIVIPPGFIAFFLSCYFMFDLTSFVDLKIIFIIVNSMSLPFFFKLLFKPSHQRIVHLTFHNYIFIYFPFTFDMLYFMIVAVYILPICLLYIFVIIRIVI